MADGAIDVEAARADTPACRRLIHFNNAGASLMPEPVYRAVVDHLALERRIGGYEAADREAGTLASFYTEFAALLGARPDEIAYVENATRAWDMVCYGMPLEAGDRVLTHDSEYASNYLALLQQARRRGIVIDRAPSERSGQIDVAALEAAITPRTRLVAITHVPTQGGLVNPAQAVGAVVRRHGLLYLLDACQSVGQMPLDVKAIGCHALTGTGRKFLRGPRGTGFLYIDRDLAGRVEPPFIDLHAATWTGEASYRLADGARRYENWESYVAGRIGLARAVRYARELGLENIARRVGRLAATLRSALGDVAGVELHDRGATLCGIVTFRKAGEEPAALAERLRRRAINVSVSRLSSARLDLGARGIDSLLRASLHYYNTDDEIDRFVDAVRR